MYNSLIVCHLNYGILLWGSQQKIDDKLHKLQKKAVRIITLKGFSAHSEPLFKKLYLLKPCDIYKCQLLKFIYKLVHKQLPHYLNQLPFSLNNTQHNYATRTNQNITIQRVNHEFAKRNIRYKMQTSYNSTPANIIEKISTHSFEGFTKYIKNQLLETYRLMQYPERQSKMSCTGYRHKQPSTKILSYVPARTTAAMPT